MLSSLLKVIFYQPTFNLLIFLYDLFQGNLGFAIIGIAAIAKLVTIPITKKQLKSAEKMKVFQKESKKIREKYSKNTDKMNEELMKLSSKYMPVQLGGCLPLIISILLLIQIRSVVINLVNKGYHAYNEVAYAESLKKEEDSVEYKIEEDLDRGNHELKVVVEATNGKTLEKIYDFEIVEDREDRIEEIEEEELDKSSEERAEEKEDELKRTKEERETDISVYNEIFDDRKAEARENIVLKRFLLVLPSEVKTVYLLEDETPEFEIFLRPPSREFIRSVKIYLDDKEVTESAEINKGEELNLDFAGIDLSRVGSEFIGEWQQFIPYLILALLLGSSQFLISKIQMTLSGKGKEEKEEKQKAKKKKKDADEEPDFQEVMQQSSTQMVYFMPLFSILMSLGYVGGAYIFPSAVSLFWTVQNGFVIIQMALTKHEEIKRYILKSWQKEK
ncbi:hypothetical protein GF362_02050 [Candidatus Dojkabacteria bacterium]|nr:hypothetical protein [Candidatus Dojkabacteria bacterium]